ncbi:uncharacterized protein LOC126894511 isoform X2 [Daktulosphaira vitifoliae]|nr:uncharacterized protein LOC126894511 isoform X2 [Daktulosphaira vitifoliae]XP_050521525.1 uncharacterized protein LOC126894511 isoform X2 [Daktulosphaira vitifoliae]XP_050521526.1 uncharacterized protein LOC126894511 isoform X2 [Daktulosphaira vitifoliae]
METNGTQKESELKVINELIHCDCTNQSSETNLEYSDLTGNVFGCADLYNGNSEVGDHCCICLEEPLEVSMLPCNHQIGLNCANDNSTNPKIFKCPLCREPIIGYQFPSDTNGFDADLDCCCGNEISQLTLKPCNHRLGYACAYNLNKEFKEGTTKCPKCGDLITRFENYFIPFEVRMQLSPPQYNSYSGTNQDHTLNLHVNRRRPGRLNTIRRFLRFA